MSRGTRALRGVALTFGLPALIVLVWWFATAHSTSFFDPPLRTIAAAFRPTWFSTPLGKSRLLEDIVPSVGRLLAGYLLALVVGVALGVTIGVSRALRAYTEPVLAFFRAIPPPVMIPVLMLFLGIGTTMKVVVIATGFLWPVVLNTVEGERGIDLVLRDTARCFRLGRVSTLRHLVLRGASPQIVTGARQALSIGIILMVISEMFAAHDGLGFTVVQFQRSFAIPEMWSGVILLGLIGVVLSLIFRIASQAVLGWYLGYRRSLRGGA